MDLVNGFTGRLGYIKAVVGVDWKLATEMLGPLKKEARWN